MQHHNLGPFVSSFGASPKSRMAALLLCFFLGYLGLHRFYVGKYFTGAIQLITVGGFGIWYIVDLIFIVLGGFTDSDGKRLVNW